MSNQTVSMLQIVKRKDTDSSDINTLDLLSLPTELQYQGWQQALSQPNATSVDEVVTLLMNAGNYDTLALALQAIDTKIKETQWAQDPLNPVGTWLRSQLQGETNVRQSFILSMQRPQAGLGITNPLAYSGIVPDYGLGITRMPTWENVLASTAGGSSVSAHGGVVTYTVAGDAHARVSKINMAGKTVSVPADAYHEAWFGAKSSRYGVTPANFAPVWYLAQYGHGSTDTTQSADATALGGYKMTCTFASPAMTVRVYSLCYEQTANPIDQRGKYIALLRAKTTDASLVCNVRAGMGYASLNNLTFLPRYSISSANAGWKYYTLGVVKIPATSGYYEQSLSYSSLSISAEKVSGSGSLEIDSLILIPEEHSIHVLFPSDAGFGTVGSTDIRGYILTRPDQRKYAICAGFTDGAVSTFAGPDEITWSLPSGTNNIIVCATQSTTSVKADAFTPTFTIYPAYNSLRGAV